MIASDCFVLRGNVNLVFPSLSSKFPVYDMEARNLVEDKGFFCPQISPNYHVREN